MPTLLQQTNIFSQYENARMETYLEYDARNHSSIPYSMLSETSGGIPIASFRKDNGELNVILDKETHGLIIGSTRSGKTTGFVIPMIMIKAMQKEKDSMFISDPKGELYQLCSEKLREQGYRVILLNFRDFKNSEFWNPLSPIFRKYQKAMNLEKTVKTKKVGNTYCSVFQGNIYATAKELKDAIEREKTPLLFDVDNDIDTLAISVISAENLKDPYWEICSQQLLKAFLYAMLEDSIPETAGNRTLITEDTFSFRTLMSIYSTFNYASDRSEGDHGYFSDRSVNSIARKTANSVILSNANNTRMCILSTFNAKMAPYKEVMTNIVTSCNSFELEELADETRPVAVFIVYRDEARTSYDTVSQFITATYSKLIEVANRQPDLQLKRPFIFLLDEFGNLPAIKDYDTTISACGSRNIWFQIVLQSYAQLTNNYGHETGEIIKENLNRHIFFGTNSAETKQQFSNECGKKTIISPRSIFMGESENIGKVDFETVSLVPVSNLDYLKPGECYITMANAEAVLHSHMERSYLCPEFACKTTLLSDYSSSIDPFDKKYIYKFSEPEKNPGSRKTRDWSSFF